MNPKLVKLIVKTGAGLIFSVAMGYTYKAGKKVEDLIDDYFAEPKEETPEN